MFLSAGRLPRPWWRALVAGVACGIALSSAAAADGSPATQTRHSDRPVQTGSASWYGDEHAGRATASGLAFDPGLLTAAHRKLPLGTRVRVVHLASGRSVIVTINDRGPYKRGRIIDLSLRAAEELGMVASGLAKVRLEVQ